MECLTAVRAEVQTEVQTVMACGGYEIDANGGGCKHVTNFKNCAPEVPFCSVKDMGVWPGL